MATTWQVVLADGRQVVAKLCDFPVAGEVDGLAALAAAGVPVPAVLGHQAGTLVLEHVDGAEHWESLGAAIAGMHQVTGREFGWHRDNRMGRFVQPNGWLPDWPSFFVERRIRPHLCDPALPSDLRTRLLRACDGPIQSRIAPSPLPSLTHGDLWRGNIVAGRWVIDPEVSFADRELDLANMLAASEQPLPQQFWAGYEAVWPLPEDLTEHAPALRLHHRLLGLRHFGARTLPALVDDLVAIGC